MPRKVNHSAKVTKAVDALTTVVDAVWEAMDDATHNGYEYGTGSLRKEATLADLKKVQRNANKIQKKLDALNAALAAAVVN